MLGEELMKYYIVNDVCICLKDGKMNIELEWDMSIDISEKIDRYVKSKRWLGRDGDTLIIPYREEYVYKLKEFLDEIDKEYFEYINIIYWGEMV